MTESSKRDTEIADPSAAGGSRSGRDWDDPAVVVGNAPPRSRWPLVVWTLAWIAWVAFLAAMRFGASAAS